MEFTQKSTWRRKMWVANNNSNNHNNNNNSNNNNNNNNNNNININNDINKDKYLCCIGCTINKTILSLFF